MPQRGMPPPAPGQRSPGVVPDQSIVTPSMRNWVQAWQGDATPLLKQIAPQVDWGKLKASTGNAVHGGEEFGNLAMVPFPGYPEGASSASKVAIDALKEVGVEPAKTTLPWGSYFLDAHGNWYVGQNHVKHMRDAGLYWGKAEDGGSQALSSLGKAFADNQLIRTTNFPPSSKNAGSIGVEIHDTPTLEQMEAIHHAFNELPDRMLNVSMTDKGAPTKWGSEGWGMVGFANPQEAMDALWERFPRPAGIKPYTSTGRVTAGTTPMPLPLD